MQTGFSQSAATVKEYEQTFTTYPFSDPNPIPLLTPVYPYFRYDGFTTKPVQQKWKVVELQNDYIKLLILPQIGGKIWAAIEKKRDRPFLYYNHVVKFRDIAMRGPWTSGGLEANYGIIGHTPSTATPVDYVTKQHEDGSVSCTIGVLDLLTRSQWRMEINLPNEKAYFTTRSFWYNTTPIEQPYYHWMNAGLQAGGNLEFIYPGTKYIGHEGEWNDWPMAKNGKNRAWYNQNNFGGYKSYHVFGRYTNFSGAYWHDADFGMVRYATHDDKAGKKIWIWGLSAQGMIWEKLLTDTDGQYVELQSGRLFNQNAAGSSRTPFKHHSFAPYGTDTWEEWWYPVLHTKGIVYANEWGALNLRQENGWLKIYFSPVQTFNDTLQIRAGETVLYSKAIKATPLQTFSDSVEASVNPNQLVAQLPHHDFYYNADTTADVLSRPVEAPAGFDWNSVYGLYVQGTEAMDQKFFAAAEEKLQECLKKDPNYLPALVRFSELMYRNLRYAEALQLAKRALSIDTHDGGANYYYGLANAALGNTVDAKDGFDIATLSVAYRSAGYTQLSRIYSKEKTYGHAGEYAIKALDFNRYNMDALQLLAVALRKQGDTTEYTKVFQTLISYDPLNHFTGFETYIRQPTEKNKQHAAAAIRSELPHETYLEAAIWYYNAGCVKEAQAVFTLCPPSTEAAYWLAFLSGRKVDAVTLRPDFVFPFRSETAAVLEQLLAKEDHWLLKYHLALIYHDRNRVAEAQHLLLSCGSEPAYAPFYAVRAAVCKGLPEANSLADLQKAASLDKSWRYQKLLTEYYLNQQQYRNALEVVQTFSKAHPDNYIMGMLYAKTLLLNQKYKETDAVLARLEIIPFEGATGGRELYREAKLMQAVAQLERRNYTKALSFINASKQWPEHLGVGKPYDEDMDLRLEDWLTYQCLQHRGETAAAQAALERIVAFQPRVDNTVRNFQPANAVVTAWAFEKLGQHETGVRRIKEQIKDFPDNAILLWSQSVLEKTNTTKLGATEKDANVRILERLAGLQNK